jgi:hypothetical protein
MLCAAANAVSSNATISWTGNERRKVTREVVGTILSPRSTL